MNLVTFVIPCYCSENSIGKVVEEIAAGMTRLPTYTYEIILVNDCSPDHTFQAIRKLTEENNNILGINLSRNFGQHAAMMAGFHQARGNVIVCLDDDGQTPAGEVGKLLHAIEQGYDVVYASYQDQHSSLVRRFGTQVNSKMTEILLDKPKNLKITSFFAMRRFVMEEAIRYDHCYPYVIGLVLRTTRKICNVPVTHRERISGGSGYTLPKLLKLWTNGFTAFSVKPLRIASLIGFISALAGFLMGIYFFICKLINPAVPMGYSSLITAITFFCGLIMMILGLIGEYIGRIYISINRAPQYVIHDIVSSEKWNSDHEKQ